MSKNLVVVTTPERWDIDLPNVELVSARDYLTKEEFVDLRQCRVFNLCRSYRYQSTGYYVSLLAEARGHKPLPSVATIQDIKTQAMVRIASDDLDDLIQKSLAQLHSGSFTLSIYFGRNMAKKYDSLCTRLFDIFPAPLLRAMFEKEKSEWRLVGLSPIPSSEIPKEHRGSVVEFAKEYFTKGRRSFPKKTPPRFDLAILVDPEEEHPPSNQKAIERFVKAAEALDIEAELITKDESGSLSEFDALFIRQTTAVNSPTYRMARRAQAEGMVVIDDPESIVRCANKVFLAELLSRHEVPHPATAILHEDNMREVLAQTGLPCVLKLPDSSFSQGVVKVADEDEFFQKSGEMLEKSDLIIAQQYMPTEFDWRVGVIDGKPLYACKYFMARGHWQIYNHHTKGNDHMGNFECLPVELVPRTVIRNTLKACSLIGKGFYGVDLKVVDGKCYVIEVNDNPSIDAGVEDKLLREHLYLRVMEVFLKRLEAISERRDEIL